MIRLGSDPVELFPYEAMQAQLKRCGKYGFLNSAILLNMLTSPAEETYDLDELAQIMEKNDAEQRDFLPKYTDVYKQRIRENAIDIGRLGYV